MRLQMSFKYKTKHFEKDIIESVVCDMCKKECETIFKYQDEGQLIEQYAVLQVDRHDANGKSCEVEYAHFCGECYNKAIKPFFKKLNVKTQIEDANTFYELDDGFEEGHYHEED